MATRLGFTLGHQVFGILAAITLAFSVGHGAYGADDSPPVKAADAPSVAMDTALFLDSRPTPEGEDIYHGLLIREIFRQALLIAAREELGVPALDATLGQQAGDSRQLNLNAAVNPEKFVELTITQTEGDKENVVFELRTKGNFGDYGVIDYARLVSGAEKLSRGRFVKVLKESGWKKTDKPRTQKKSTVAAQSVPLNCIAQFGALRAAHREIRSSGESTRRLTRLAIGYATLGELTRYHWNSNHKVFTARGLLYAQRLRSKRKNLPLGHWVRAYVRAVSGLEGKAVDDLKAAEAMVANLPESKRPKPPQWVATIEQYCHGDTQKLLDIARTKGEQQSLAYFLALRTLEHTTAKAALLSLSYEAIAKNQQCYRIVDTIYAAGGVATLHGASVAGASMLEGSLPTVLRDMPGLPKSTKGSMGGYATANWVRAFLGAPVGQRVREISPVAAKLANILADSEPDDNLELSWDVLGRMLQDMVFVNAYRRARVLRDVLGVEASEFVEKVRPTIKDHRFLAFVESYKFNARQPTELMKVLRDLDLKDCNVNMDPMINATKIVNTPGKIQGSAAWRVAYRSGDRISTDIAEYISHTDEGGSLRLAHRLFKVNPSSALAMSSLIMRDWEFASEHAEKWGKEYGDHPAVAAAFGWRFQQQEQYEKAESYFKRSIKLSPDRQVYEFLAAGYMARGDEKQFLSTLVAFLGQPDYGLDHSIVQSYIARHHMDRKRFKDAHPYALAAAESWSGNGLKLAADCEEGLGNWEQSELWIRRLSERYGGSQYEWYFWCLRTGQGDVIAAQRLAETWLQASKDSNVVSDLRIAGVVYTSLDRHRESRAAFEKAFRQTDYLYDAFHLILSAAEQGETAVRNQMLEQLSQVDVRNQSLIYVRFGEMLTDFFHGRSELTSQNLENVLAGAGSGDRTNILYFAGRLFELDGKKDEGEQYFKLSARDGVASEWTTVLASQILRDRGIDFSADGETEKEIE